MPSEPDKTWTTMDKELFEAGDIPTAAEWLAHILQNLNFVGGSHDHNGDAGDGGTLATADPKAIWFYGSASGSPFG